MPPNPVPIKSGWTVHPPHPAPAPRSTGANYKLPFGRHRGQRLADVPPDYLAWLCDHAESPALRLLAKKELGLDVVLDDEQEPRADLAAVALPGVVWRWNEAMRAKFAADPPALVVVAAGLTELQKLTTEYTRKPWPNEEVR